MTSFRIKQIPLALCLMMSLLIGHASACACSHHDHAKKVETDDCHSHHKAAASTEAVSDGNVCDNGCICITEQPSPVVASKSASTEFKPDQMVVLGDQISADVEFAAVSSFYEPAL